VLLTALAGQTGEEAKASGEPVRADGDPAGWPPPLNQHWSQSNFGTADTNHTTHRNFPLSSGHRAKKPPLRPK